MVSNGNYVYRLRNTYSCLVRRFKILVQLRYVPRITTYIKIKKFESFKKLYLSVKTLMLINSAFLTALLNLENIL